MFMTVSKTRVSSLNPRFHLPEDVVIEILSRLPVKSLVRFTLVCKFWHALIGNPKFISTHLKQNLSLDFSHLFVTYELCRGKFAMSLHAMDALDTPINLGFPFLGESNSIFIIGVCNGLVCMSLSSNKFDFVICNLLTRWYSKIPFFYALQAERLHNGKATYGFAFDSSSNDFKVINITRYYDTQHKKKAGVYTLSTNRWREIDIIVPVDEDLIMRQYSTSAIIKDVLYWELYMYPSNNPALLSFNMVDESFRVISGPTGFNWTWNGHYWKSFQLKEELAIFALTSKRDFVVWALDVDSVGWSLRCHGLMPAVLISLDVNEVANMKLIGRTKKGDVIFEDCSSSGVKRFSYDFDSGETKEINLGEIGHLHQLFGYKESLLPIKKNNHV